ncbi:lipopolysaccharide biosynthesis protein [Duncaniella muris]|uniref:lipopolysaccharide biosynthesis protein n=3 Tax=Bacteria TaxID=2 RepID=UPI0025A51901|nr:MATE family efflux transporter [Duncaniella muris]
MNLGSLRMFFKKGDQRTILLKKNILASVVLKGISMLISLFIVPITINYVNPVQYGIWLTLSSLMAWFYFFDIGLTNGFRNRFTTLKACGKLKMARVYVSTTYAALFISFVVFMSVLIPVSFIVDWSSVLKVDQSYCEELRMTFAVLLGFFGLNIVFQTFSTMLIADQRSAFSSGIQVLGQGLALLVIFILTKTVKSGSITSLAFIFSGIPFVTLVLCSIIFFNTRYRQFRPNFGYIRLKYVKDILGIGGKFFIITTSMLFIYQIINIIISRNLGPEVVTQYNISHRYFSILTMVSSLVIGNVWSAFTDAYAQKNFEWMRRIASILQKALLAGIPVTVIMYFLATPFINLWIDKKVTVPAEINICEAIYIFANFCGNIYMYMINGIGKIHIQLVIYLTFAIIAYPCMSWLCRLYGVPGVLLIPASVYFIQAISGHIQINKILNNTATGYWDK